MSGEENLNLINTQEFCGENNSEKKLYLLQLPKELCRIKNLKLNFNDLKNDSIVEIVNKFLFFFLNFRLNYIFLRKKKSILLI